ncbi:hypothetical protein HMPREF9970_0964 [Lachnoanaerobaculum saburreum F0468]|jgi:hypothetical protein|uniref:Lipoprotein n=1 Tax=Lachnoanaerobaculum saburreum F0468 TaxID=1095750 RepID=I0R4J7_9FIRM|nr:hypothetical protein [Lachnoanaerobaculum saburreum]EIC94605.1 hypothetical protein HMPREF9970_0964 [Lachnoanaerobaculum saburreum F0468]
MKRCFKLGMVVVLSLCFLGCGAKADKKSSETVSEFKAEDISLGKVVDGVYTSKMLQLKFDGNANDMDVSAEEEFTNRLDKKVVKRSDMEAVHDRLDKGYYIGDMEAHDNKNKGNYIEVEIYKDIHHEMKSGLEKYIDNEVKKQKGEQKERYKDPKVEKTTRDFLGDKLLSVDIIIDEDGIEVADSTLYKQLGEYFVEIHVRGDKKEDIDKYLGMFEKYTGSDDNVNSSKSEESNTPDTKSDIEFSKGEYIGETYINKQFDISFDAKSNGYKFDELYKSATEAYLEEDMLKYIGMGGAPVVVYATKDGDSSSKIGISIDDIESDIDAYIDKVNKNTKNSQKTEMEFCGKEVPCVEVESKDGSGKKIYRYTVYIQSGKYVAVIDSFGEDKDEAKKVLESFTRVLGDTNTESVEDTTEVNDSENTLVLGSISDKVYSNKMLNIKFDISKTGLEFVSDEGLKNMGNDGIDKSDLAAVKKHIEDGKSFTDMFAVDNNDTTKKISVSLAKNDMLMPMDEYLDAHKAAMESQLSKVPKDQLKSSRVKKSDAYFLGQELSCLDIYVDTTVGKQCQKYLFVVKDHYMMIIVSSGKDEKEAQEGLDLFQQYQ